MSAQRETRRPDFVADRAPSMADRRNTLRYCALRAAWRRRGAARFSAAHANAPSRIRPLSIRVSQLWPQLSRRQLP